MYVDIVMYIPAADQPAQSLRHQHSKVEFILKCFTWLSGHYSRCQPVIIHSKHLTLIYDPQCAHVSSHVSCISFNFRPVSSLLTKIA